MTMRPRAAGAAGVDNDAVASGGRRRPSMAMKVADATNVDHDEATNGGHCRPTADANDDEVASGGRRHPTTAMTVADAANVDERVADAAVPPRPQLSPMRPTSTTTRPQTIGTAVPRPTPAMMRSRVAG